MIGLNTSSLPSLKPTPQTYSTTSFVIDKDGEMPEGAVTPNLTSTPTSQRHTPVPPEGNALIPPRLSSFPQYEVEDDIIRTSTPEPIKVIRPKKKGTGKKKRTPVPTAVETAT